ncbi:isovaleryl-CoA dehydrogenase, mitochondrial [Belonocnema kinseyi]|uniref:isovaleryl-CoA dehydrogenase, mitochondrial n=1 Tax=Belonocnema kinseyi TaxID=2817044 RepID=UPI00143D0948|nr:isovaleryl-CoA dehydrogenase, mitochondrial [Belonocnema kinseyi]
MSLRVGSRLLKTHVNRQTRFLSQFYNIDDSAFGFTDQQKELRNLSFNFAQKELAPIAGEIDKKNNFENLRPFWKELGRLGFLGITAKPEYGGTGGGYLDHVIILEEISRACAAVGLSCGAHSNLCLNQIHRNGTEDQKQKYLPKFSSAYLDGLETFTFDNLKAGAANILGELNKGVYVLFSGLDLERLVLSAVSLGILQSCCDVAFQYAHDRKQFGKPIAGFQLIQGKIADMHMALCASKCYIYTIARACDSGFVSRKDCSAVITYASEMSTKAALDVIQILGGNGYINDYPAGRLLRDAKLLEIGAGTSEIRRMVISRAITEEYS